MAVQTDSLYNGPKGSLVRGSENARVFLDGPEIQLLRKRGATIGSHSASHRILSECNDEELVVEDRRCESGFLRRSSMKRSNTLRFPMGKNAITINGRSDLSRRSGFKYLYSTNPKFFSGPVANDAVIPRLSLLEEQPEEITFLVNRPLLKTVVDA